MCHVRCLWQLPGRVELATRLLCSSRLATRSSMATRHVRCLWQLPGRVELATRSSMATRHVRCLWQLPGDVCIRTLTAMPVGDDLRTRPVYPRCPLECLCTLRTRPKRICSSKEKVRMGNMHMTPPPKCISAVQRRKCIWDPREIICKLTQEVRIGARSIRPHLDAR
jgi:hypothetical protein